MQRVSRVVVVGAGTMGAQIALQIAWSGIEVALVDASAAQVAAAEDLHRSLCQRALERGRMSAEGVAEALARITTGTDLTAASVGVELAIEAVFERLEPKREVFAALDRATPAGAILASNSSSIGISRLAEVTGRPDKCCNLHFFHPVTVMQLVEVVRGPQTSDATIAAVFEFVRSIGRIPVLVRREIHGFIVNRILFAATEQAMELLEGGYASAEDIDLAVKKGLNWPMGPFELMDFSGLDILHAAFEDRARLEGGPPVPASLRRLVADGHLGRKSGRGFYDYGSKPA
ncbi:MAG TPA: 3-hydroxyacyl-CoA dehydrogenase family protein [Candidatus Nitrosotalea sp.]|nr:3-hydroxyacyl-CoA dehydrogenase family protein [Candidatus Nitrosotalea sp.]